MSFPEISFKRLESFLAVANVGNIAWTATLLSTSQPSLSRQIAAIEQDLGVQLFTRTGRGVELTEAGEILQRHAMRIASEMKEARDALDRVQGRIRGAVRLGLPPTVAHVLAEPLVDALSVQFPELEVTIMEGYSGHVLEWLSHGRVDMGVLYETGQMSQMPADLLVEEELHLIASPELARQFAETITGSEIAGLKLVLPTRAHGLRQLVDARFAEFGIPLDVKLQVDSFATTLRMVETGKGFTILPRISIAEQIESGRLAALKIEKPNLRRRLLFATSPAHPPGEAVRALATFTRRHSAKWLRL